MIRKKLWILMCMLILISACAEHSAAGENGYAVYYATREPCAEGKAIDSESRALSGAGEPVEELMSLLLENPDSPDLLSPFPAGVALNSWALREGVLYLEMSEGYGGLSGISLTVADYCITLTLSQLPDVESVVIAVDGGLVPSRYYRTLHTSDVLLSQLEDLESTAGVTLYFPNSDGAHLSIERRDLPEDEEINRSKAVLTALMQGPEGEGLLSLFPEGTQLLSVTTENGICYVNFSKPLKEAPIGRTSEGVLLLYSIVDTLCTIEGVEKVQLLIEGEATASFGGVPVKAPLEADYSLVEKD